MRNAIALVILGLFTAVAGCVQQRDLAGNEPAGWEDRPGKLTAAEMMAIVVEESEAWMNMSGCESQVQIRLSRVYWGGDYTPKRKDIPELLKGMLNEKADIPAKLCIASYLLELNVEEGRTFIAKQAGSEDFRVVENVASLLLSYREKNPHREWATDLALAILKADRLAAKTHSVAELVELVKDKRKIAQLRAAVERGEAIEASQGQFYDLCRYLADMKCKKAVPVFIDVVRRHPDDWSVIDALSRIDLRAAEPVLLETLVYKHSERQYSLKEVLSIAEIGSDPYRMRQILANMHGSGTDLRSAQLQTLAKLKSTKAVPILIKYLDHEDVIRSLAKIEDKRAIAPLQAYVKRKNIQYRCEAKIALAELRAKNKTELATSLLKMLHEEKASYNITPIVWALGKCGDARAVEPLLELTRTCNDSRPNACWESISALGEIGDRRAVEPLIKLARDSGDKILEECVVKALADIGDRRAVEFIAEFGRNAKEPWHPSTSIVALGKLGGDQAAEAVLEHAKTSKDGWIVQQSIEALGKIGGHKATSGLIDLFSRDFSKVRPFGKMRRTAKTYHGFIVEALQKATGQKFGDNPKAWKAWLNDKAQREKG